MKQVHHIAIEFFLFMALAYSVNRCNSKKGEILELEIKALDEVSFANSNISVIGKYQGTWRDDSLKIETANHLIKALHIISKME